MQVGPGVYSRIGQEAALLMFTLIFMTSFTKMVLQFIFPVMVVDSIQLTAVLHSSL